MTAARLTITHQISNPHGKALPAYLTYLQPEISQQSTDLILRIAQLPLQKLATG